MNTRCSNCNRDNHRPDAAFCAGCGARFSDVPVAAAPQSSSSPPFLTDVATVDTDLSPTSDLPPKNLTPVEGAEQEVDERVADRLDIVRLLAGLIGALRRVRRDHTGQVFRERVSKLIESVQPFPDIRSAWENKVFVEVMALAKHRELLPAVNEALAVVPPRLHPYVRSTERISELDTAGPWDAEFERWPYLTYYSTYSTDEAVVASMLQQTVREGCCLMHAGTQFYLEEEEARMEGGLYSPAVEGQVRMTHSQFSSYAEQAPDVSDDQKATALLGAIFPLGHPEIAKQLAAAMPPIPGIFPQFRYMPLADWELLQLRHWVSDPFYDHSALVPLLRRLWKESIAALGRRGALGAGLGPLLHGALISLTSILNFHNRRVDPVAHQDYGYSVAAGYEIGNLNQGAMREAAALAKIRAALSKEKPDIEKALFPTEMSLFRLEFESRRTVAIKRRSIRKKKQGTVRSGARVRARPGRAVDQSMKDAIREAIEAWHQSRATAETDDDKRADTQLIIALHDARSTLGLSLKEIHALVKAGEIVKIAEMVSDVGLAQ